MKLPGSALNASRVRFGVASVAALIVLTGAFSVAELALPASVANAATLTIDQCNNVAASPQGATTGLTCTVTVVNTISGSTRGSVTTVTRQCTLAPCAPGNGTFTTRSPNLVTTITQCNGSGNDAAPPLITCRVTITNNISANTPGAQPVTAATVNQCVGTGGGGGFYLGTSNPLVCDPFPASTTNATVTQCNGSVTGGGSTAVCSVATASKISPAIPVRVNQCNGTGNKGGTLLTCATSITTNITSAASATPNTQATQVPTGAVASGDGSTSGGTNDSQGFLAGAMLFAGVGGAAVVAVRRRRRLNS